MSRIAITAVFASVMTLALGQAPSSPDELKAQRPGAARDGSGPAEGAIKGGSLEPDIRESPAPQRDVERCKELSDKLREDCLRDLHRKDAPKPSRENVKK